VVPRQGKAFGRASLFGSEWRFYMRAETRQRIQAARAQTEHRDRTANAETVIARSSIVPTVLVDQMMQQPKWWTFSEIKERFSVSYDTVSRAFRGHDGVAKFGSDYRVSESAVRHWLSEALAEGRKAA
jgi:DNA-binding LacI/PurR family transcriptional regulator